MIDSSQIEKVLSVFRESKLISSDEVDAVISISDPSFPFAEALRHADTVHIHGRVDDVSAMPHEIIKSFGGEVENQRDGYIKYVFAGGINMIYSSIDVSQDDLLGERSGLPPRPFMDHIGIDLRRETDEVKDIFDNLPARALS